MHGTCLARVRHVRVGIRNSGIRNSGTLKFALFDIAWAESHHSIKSSASRFIGNLFSRAHLVLGLADLVELSASQNILRTVKWSPLKL